MNNVERDAAIDDLIRRLTQLESDFASHFHAADELNEVADPPIVPVDEAKPLEEPAQPETSADQQEEAPADPASAPAE